jgi:ketosteroid isomerase-like protein
MKRLLAFLLLLLHVNVFLPRASGQDILPLDKIMNQKDLDKTITALDAAVFDSYNKCDLQRFETFFVDDVEFYHDQGGVTLGKRELSDSVKRNICGQTTRELVSLQAFYMKGYGALETGVHRFHHPGHEEEMGVGEGRFIHLWRYKDGAWKITRVISYEHHQAAK